MNQIIEQIIEKRLIIFSGKGGTGKSTVAAALAVSAARRGKKVLIVEISYREMIPELLGYTETTGFEGAEVRPDIFSINLNPLKILENFIKHHIPIKFINERIIESRLYRYFVSAAPGLKELMALGHIMRLEAGIESAGGSKDFDCIIVDSPATGHGISLFRVPQLVMDTFRLGLVTEQSRKVRDLLVDTKKTIMNIVTLPEEMPVNESLELYDSIKKYLNIPIGYVFINGMFPRRFDESDLIVLSKLKEISNAKKDQNKQIKNSELLLHCMISAAEYTKIKSDINEFYANRLKAAFDMSCIEIPFFFYEADRINAMAEFLSNLKNTESIPGKKGFKDRKLPVWSS